MTQRTRAYFLPGVVATLLCAPLVEAQDQNKSVVSELIGTADGSKFLLVPSAETPVIHWVYAIPAGELIDPPQHPELSYAVARATLSGSDTIGTSNFAEEQKTQGLIDATMFEVNQMLASGQMPTAELARRLEQLTSRQKRLLDPGEWERQLRAAPSSHFTVEETPNAIVTSVTTSRRGLSTVARLFMDRRENALLRDIQPRYNEVLAELAARATTDSDRVRAEMIDLAFYGARTRVEEVATIVPKKVAHELYRKMFSPSATYHVITGGFELKEMREFLQRQFIQSKCEYWVPPTRDIRRDSKMRVSTLTDGQRHGIAVGIRTEADITFDQLRILGQWFGGGRSSQLARYYARAGIMGIECRITSPFPAGANPGILFIEAWTGQDPRVATSADLLAPMIQALDQSANRITYPAIDAARSRAIGARDTIRSDPRTLAHWLALECGMHGRPVEQALSTEKTNISYDLFRGFAEEILGNGSRTIVYMETTP